MWGLRRATWVRVAPFAVFMGLLGLRGQWASWPGLGDARWIYGVTLFLVGGMLLAWRREYAELARSQWPGAGEAALAAALGLVVFLVWIRLDAPWMQMGTATASFSAVDASGALVWPLVLVRWVGASLMVPVMEELFWRSFLMRWIQDPAFEAVDPRGVGVRSVVVSTGVFMLAHTLWLAAIIAGMLYAWLYRRRGQLGSAVIAHAVTNGSLGIWVVLGGHWEFW